jgi:hypothetical protein
VLWPSRLADVPLTWLTDLKHIADQSRSPVTGRPREDCATGHEILADTHAPSCACGLLLTCIFGFRSAHPRQELQPFYLGFLGLLFLIYPQIQYWRVRRANKPVETEHNNLLIDSVLIGMFVAAVQFSVWLSFSAILATLLNRVAIKGWPGAVESTLALLIGTSLWASVYGLQLSPDTEWPAALICVFGTGGYVLSMIHVGFQRNLQLRDIQTRLRVILNGIQIGVFAMSEQASSNPQSVSRAGVRLQRRRSRRQQHQDADARAFRG